MTTSSDPHHDRASTSDDRASAPGAPSDAEASLFDGDRADALSRVLRAVRLRSAYFFRWDASWPFATAVPDGEQLARAAGVGGQALVSYHVVTEGHCFGGLIGAEPERLEVGDVLLVPRGQGYVIGSSPSACREARVALEPIRAFCRAMARGDLPPIVQDGGGGEAHSRLACGFLGCDLEPFNPVLSALDPVVVVRPSDADADRVRFLVDYALSETTSTRSGSRAVLLQLGELLFLEVLRRCIDQAPEASSGWFAGLSHPSVGRALCALHRSPESPWTLESLARAAGASRSQLAESFAALLGQPPMQYLARWRLQLAMSRLRDAGAKVSAVAHEVGYGSEAAFSRAFKRVMGLSPAQWRRKQLGGGP